jgi:putative membrane protein insertion efficiency factor
MGHRHTPEEPSGARGVCCADGGSAAVDLERDAGLETAVVRRSAGVRAALFALRFYKAYLSLLFAGACRFEPTCSRYAYEAIERFGVARGSWLALKRLGRCQPLSGKFGFDPVPEVWGGERSSANLYDAAADRDLVDRKAAAVTHQEVLS